MQAKDPLQAAYVHAVSLAEILAKRAQAQTRRRAFAILDQDGNEKANLTYGELHERALAIASFLRTRLQADKSRPGRDPSPATVILFYPPGLDYIAAFFACFYAGAIAVPLYPPHRRRQKLIGNIIENSGAKLALTTTSILKAVTGSDEQGGQYGALSLFSTDELPPTENADGFTPPPPDAVAFLQYTSGSTGVPKGVMVSHANLMANQKAIGEAFATSASDICLNWLPLYHDMGLIGTVLHAVYRGFPSILMSATHFIESPLRWLRGISRYRASLCGAPNFAYELCTRKVAHPDLEPLDLRSWRTAFNGAEPVCAETLERFSETFAPVGFRAESFVPCYGLAEATLFVCGGRPGRSPRVLSADARALAAGRCETSTQEPSLPLVSCGFAPEGHHILAVDPARGRVLADGEVGELWVSGKSVTLGYWNQAEETAETFGVRLADGGEGTFLRTGDLGFTRNGEWFITGRMKELIIIRGRNYYPRDIEAVVEKSHGCLSAGRCAAFSWLSGGEENLAVAVEVKRSQVRRLEKAAVFGAVRAAVAASFDVSARAVILLRPGGLPLTSSGKIRRNACREAFLEGALQALAISRQGEAGSRERPPILTRAALAATEPHEREARLSAYLANRLCALLGLDAGTLDATQPLVELGLDSLSAAELSALLENDFGVRLSLERLLAGLSLQAVTEQALAGLEEEPHKPETGPAPGMAGDFPRVSFEQERLWFLDQMNPGLAAYHLPAAFHLHGVLDRAWLERCFHRVLQRHSAPRTRFGLKDGLPVQVISPREEPRMRWVDLQGLSPALREEQCSLLLAKEVKRPFDLATDLLIRVLGIQSARDRFTLVLTVHHMVADLWSLDLALREWGALYREDLDDHRMTLTAPDISFADIAVWQRQEFDSNPPEASLSFWRERFADAPARSTPPGDHERPETVSFRGGALEFEIGSRPMNALRAFARSRGATPFAALMTAFQIAMARWAGQEDMVVGMPVSGRGFPGGEKALGFLAYPLPLRLQLHGDPSFDDVLQRVKHAVLELLAHQGTPFSKVVEAVRPPLRRGYHPFFQVMFSLVDKPLEGPRLPGVQTLALSPEKGATEFDLFLTAYRQDERLQVKADYNADLFEPETVQCFLQYFREVLEVGPVQPDTPMSGFRLPEPLARLSRTRSGTGRRPLCAIAASFTAEPLGDVLRFWAERLGLDLEIAFAPYQQVFQQLLDPESLFSRNRSGFNAILLRPEDWLRYEPSHTGSDDLARKLARHAEDWLQSLKTAAPSFRNPMLVWLCPASQAVLEDAVAGPALARALQRLSSQLRDLDGVVFTAAESLNAQYPVADVEDPHTDAEGHVPFTPTYFAALGTSIIRTFLALSRPPLKAIVLDCDDTLWGGAVGELGPRGVILDEPRLALQRFMAARQQEGVLLCLCSKNEAEDVAAVFHHRPEMPLKRSHLVGERVSWRPKSEMIAELADELNLGLDSFALVDDNPVECAEVRARHPACLVFQLPSDPTRIEGFLRHIWAFDQVRVTDSDRQRTRLYRQNRERESYKTSASSLADFLAGLELEVSIAPVAHTDRVSQLTQRTNQFNASTIRRTETEVRELNASPGTSCFEVSVRDRFGDYGLVGVMFCDIRSADLTVDTFLLSCRVLGRGVEHRMLSHLGALARELHRPRVVVRYQPSARNQPILDFLAGSRGERLEGEGFAFSAEAAERLTYEPNHNRAEAGSSMKRTASEETPSAQPAMSQSQLETILSLREPTAIRAAVGEWRRQVGATALKGPEPFAAPRNPTEQLLANLYGEVLGLERVGVHDNFLARGGYSLQAIQLISRIRESFGVDLPLHLLFEGPTIAQLSKNLETLLIEQAEETDLDSVLGELEGLSQEEIQALLTAEAESL